MEKRLIFLWPLVFLSLIIASSRLSAIQCELIRTDTIPTMTRAFRVSFCDLEPNGVPDILAVGDSTIILYSPSADSILFQSSYDYASTLMAPRILATDINRDSVPDLIIAYRIRTASLMPYSDSGMVIDFYDGASGYALSRHYYTNRPPGIISAYAQASVSDVDGLCARDINADGYNELLLSYRCSYSGFTDGNFLTHFTIWYGYTHLYHSFPDSLHWSTDVLLGNPAFIPSPPFNLIIGDSYSHRDFTGQGVDFSESQYAVRSINWEGPAFVLGESFPSCAGEHSFLNGFRLGCAGNIDQANPEPEMLVDFEWRYYCGPDLAEQGQQLRLYTIYSPDSVGLVWSKEDGARYLDYAFLPDYPGSVFAFRSSGVMVRIDIADGGILDSTAQLPKGSLFWDVPFDRNCPNLVALDSNRISIYAVDASLDIQDRGEAPMPRRLSLGAPRPNPFNAMQTIPIMAVQNSHLTVDIYNLLGQKLARVYNGRVTSEQFNVRWDAGQLPSGIYLIRATSDGESITVKSVLLK